MKFSVSVSPRIAKDLRSWVEIHNSNASAIVETALRLFGELPAGKREAATRATHDSKKIPSPSAWRETFWRLLSEEFGVTEIPNAPMGPRMHGNGHCRVVFLLNDVRNSDPDALIVHIMTQVDSGIPDRLTMTRNYAVDESVYQAARDVRAWIEAYDDARDKFDAVLYHVKESGRFGHELADGQVVIKTKATHQLLLLGMHCLVDGRPWVGLQQVSKSGAIEITRDSLQEIDKLFID